MPTISEEFRLASEGVQKDIDAAEIFDNWTPPVAPGGTVFACILKKIKCTMEEDEKKGQYARIIMEWLITDGIYKGRTFATFHKSIYPGTLVPIFTLASLLTGDSKYREARMLVESAEICGAYEGKAVVELLGRNSKTGYVNFSLGKLVEVLKT
ncbi:hypothetical protein [Candidatus Magnetobacterium casense]|uniref:Uncharacterized protein n=1 Tax=Candidatus Magnetobacterium casense TaxID=1455061 RepID=A0ABS6S189_9BACT|nr:hypothetical protein [Candidatus Magnetobacterium casensis]MBV6342614.1 hypothetical protein [Candidatus Magnetobacterium casensis]